uniref:5-hydroxytryptamine receptor 1E n=1 Tax=Oncorhynchus kisutch TaxID=8019 RepID=A0A8C7KLZ6_ONCKI
MVVLVVLLGLLTLLTALVNGAVITAICTTKKLHLPANYLICSLAFTDFLVSILVMPVSILYIATETWSLGQVVCEAWLSVDMTCCTCSILHLCVIALDRYWAITKAIEYARKRSARRAAVMVGIIWVISVFISIPPLFWRYRPGSHGPKQCIIQHNHVGYTIYSTFGAFYIPMTLILILLNVTIRIPSFETEMEAADERHQICTSRERKAARILGLILGAFILCWMPFFLKELLVGLQVITATPHVSDFLTWLGYFNSLINPLLYTSFNEDFKLVCRPRLNVQCCPIRECIRESYMQCVHWRYDLRSVC